MGVLDKSFDVFVMHSGVSKRVYLEKCGILTWNLRKPRDKPPFLQLNWPEDMPKAEEEEEVEDGAKKSAGSEKDAKEKSNDDKGSKKEVRAEDVKTILQDLHVFSLVRIRLESDQDPLKYNAILLHPKYSAETLDAEAS